MFFFFSFFINSNGTCHKSDLKSYNRHRKLFKWEKIGKLAKERESLIIQHMIKI